MNGDGEEGSRRINERPTGKWLRDIEAWIVKQDALLVVDRQNIKDLMDGREGQNKLIGWLVGLSAFGGMFVVIAAEALGGMFHK